MIFRHFPSALVNAGGVGGCGTSRAETSHKWMAHKPFQQTHKRSRGLAERMGTQLKRINSLGLVVSSAARQAQRRSRDNHHMSSDTEGGLSEEAEAAENSLSSDHSSVSSDVEEDSSGEAEAVEIRLSGESFDISPGGQVCTGVFGMVDIQIMRFVI